MQLGIVTIIEIQKIKKVKTETADFVSSSLNNTALFLFQNAIK